MLPNRLVINRILRNKIYITLSIAALLNVFFTGLSYGCGCGAPPPLVVTNTSPEDYCPGDLITTTTTTTTYKVVACSPYSYEVDSVATTTQTRIAGPGESNNCNPPPSPCTDPAICPPPPPCTNPGGCPPPCPPGSCCGGSGSSGGFNGGIGSGKSGNGFDHPDFLYSAGY